MWNANNKKRVGVITFHRAINYGALLQAYALQEVFKKLESDCHIIDYRNARIESEYKIKTLLDCRNWRDMARYVFFSRYHSYIYQKFRNFAETYLNLTQPYHSIEQLRKITTEYDAFVCGSDQVWNYKQTDFDKAYFLDFCEDNHKKNAYAASFGISHIPDEFVGEYRSLLENYNHISVRELQGKVIIYDLIKRNAEVVLDPVMLLNKSEWSDVAIGYEKINNYILLYSFGLSQTMKNFIINLSIHKRCPIVYISYSLLKPIDATYEKYVGPAEFLGLLNNAKYIVTNSFHGTAFAINFNKDFFLEMLPETAGVNSRLENILDLFDLRKRQIVDGKNEFIDIPIDYEKVNQKLYNERQRSLTYLKNIIKI